MEKRELAVLLGDAYWLGDDKPTAIALRDKTHYYVYTQMCEGNENALALGCVGVNVMGYWALEQYIGDFVNLPNDVPYPLSEMSESDAVAICEIARRWLEGEHRAEIEKGVDLSNEELKRLSDVVSKALA